MSVSGYIERSTYAGLEDHYAALEETLKVHCERNADASSCCSDLSTQRFNDKQLVDRRLQHPSDIDVLNRYDFTVANTNVRCDCDIPFNLTALVMQTRLCI